MHLKFKNIAIVVIGIVAIALLAFGAGKIGSAFAQSRDENKQNEVLVADNSNNSAAGVARNNPPKISGFKVETSGGFTYLNIKTDRDFKFYVFALTQPSPRLVLDAELLKWGFGPSNGGVIAGSGIIKQVRYAHKSANQSRIVLDLEKPAKIESQEFISSLGSKYLRIKLSETNATAFASNPPKQITKASVVAPVAPKSKKKYKIVIDPGHGGRDPGALGFTKGVYEKDVTLASALRLREILRKDPRFEVIMTRENDTFLDLEDRIVIARDIRADLFISLHADSAGKDVKAQGATVYTLSEEGGDRSRKLLNRDNWTVVAPNRTNDNMVTEILRDLTQRDTKNQSAIFAETILKNIKDIGPLTSSSHRRAGFFVLLSPTVPAVLFEMGFISDSDDEARLIDENFRKRQMQGVAKAIDEYFDARDLKK